jgi:formylglycine-generating enzyme required for sulfatase activity
MIGSVRQMCIGGLGTTLYNAAPVADPMDKDEDASLPSSRGQGQGFPGATPGRYRSAYRGQLIRQAQSVDLGFRVVLTIAP